MTKNKILHLNVKKKYWNQVKEGTKTEEYREHKMYWVHKLITKKFDEIHYHLGYPSKNQPERTLKFRWNGFMVKSITHELFGKDVKVFAIDLTKPM